MRTVLIFCLFAMGCGYAPRGGSVPAAEFAICPRVNDANAKQELTARAEVAFTRGLRSGASDPGARFAAALLEMYVTHAAVAVGGPFDQGFEAGREDALAGRPSVEDEG